MICDNMFVKICSIERLILCVDFLYLSGASVLLWRAFIAEITVIDNVISEDDRISTLLSFILMGEPVKIAINGTTGVLMDETAYDGLIETIRILQDNPAIVRSLNERECGMFVDERDIQEYV